MGEKERGEFQLVIKSRKIQASCREISKEKICMTYGARNIWTVSMDMGDFIGRDITMGDYIRMNNEKTDIDFNQETRNVTDSECEFGNFEIYI